MFKLFQELRALRQVRQAALMADSPLQSPRNLALRLLEVDELLLGLVELTVQPRQVVRIESVLTLVPARIGQDLDLLSHRSVAALDP